MRDLKDIAAEVLELPMTARAELASQLLDSLEDLTGDLPSEVATEIERRMSEYRAGRVKTISWQELRAHLHRSNR